MPQFACHPEQSLFAQLRKNSGFDFALKGRGFKPRRRCPKINPAL
jgi:hypothetical protein